MSSQIKYRKITSLLYPNLQKVEVIYGGRQLPISVEKINDQYRVFWQTGKLDTDTATTSSKETAKSLVKLQVKNYCRGLDWRKNAPVAPRSKPKTVRGVAID